MQSAISQSREKQNGVANPVREGSRLKACPKEIKMSAVSVLQQFFTRASDRKSTLAQAHEFSAENIVESGDFRIDLRNRTVKLCGKNLELTSQEFDVLMFLVNHPQRMITAQTVLTTSGTTNQARTEFLPALLSLRKKLDVAALSKRYLRIEPWVVYRFDPNASKQ